MIIQDDGPLFEREDKDLQRAISVWGRGDPISADLWFRLSEKGYDVETLQEQYLH